MTQPVLLNLVIPTRNYHATEHFYKDVLQLPLLFQQSGDKASCFVKAGSVNIAICTAWEGAPTGPGFMLDFVVPSLAPIRQRLLDAQIEIVREWKEQGADMLL